MWDRFPAYILLGLFYLLSVRILMNRDSIRLLSLRGLTSVSAYVHWIGFVGTVCTWEEGQMQEVPGSGSFYTPPGISHLLTRTAILIYTSARLYM